MMKYDLDYMVKNRKSGDIIDWFETKEDAEIALQDYEEFDKKQGKYTKDFYEIVEVKFIFIN